MEPASDYKCLSREVTLEKSIEKYSRDIADIQYRQSRKLQNHSRYSPSDSFALEKQLTTKDHRSSRSPEYRPQYNSRYRRNKHRVSPTDYDARNRNRRRSNSRERSHHSSFSRKRNHSRSRSFSPPRNSDEKNSPAAFRDTTDEVRTTLIKSSKNVVPEFDPLCREDTVFDWIAKVEVCKEIFGWDEKEMVEVAVSKLAGTAKNWYMGLTTAPDSWNKLRVKLIESFPCQDNYADLLESMLARRIHPRESLEFYYHKKMALLNLCGIRGRNAVDCIIHGIKNEILRSKIQAAQLRDTDQLLVYFQGIDTTKDICSTYNKDLKKIATDNTLSVYCYKCFEMGHKSNTCTRANANDKKSFPICFKCSKPGHKSNNCTKAIATENKMSLYCNTCFKHGHTSNNCKAVKKKKCYTCGGLGHLANVCRISKNFLKIGATLVESQIQPSFNMVQSMTEMPAEHQAGDQLPKGADHSAQTFNMDSEGPIVTISPET